MIISNTALIGGLSGIAAVSLVTRVFLSQRELKSKNAYGIPQFKSYVDLALHRTFKFASVVFFAFGAFGAGGAHLTGLDLIVEDRFAGNVMGVLIGLSTVIALGASAIIVKRKGGKSAGEARRHENVTTYPGEENITD